jgi:hypothetical protein
VADDIQMNGVEDWLGSPDRQTVSM